MRHRDLVEGDPKLMELELARCARDRIYFINQWGWTFDPRNAEENTGLPSLLPFDLWPKQIEFIGWVDDMISDARDGLCEKSRDSGFTWLCAAYAVQRWRFSPGFTSVFGSRKQELVDKLGDPKTIFEKIRVFVRNLPRWMLPAGYDSRQHDNFLRIINPENGNSIVGEAGDEIGRGARSTWCVIDEAGFLEKPDAVDRSTSATSRSRLWGSTVNGVGNWFYNKRIGTTLSSEQIFVFDVEDNPLHTPEWIAAKRASMEPHIWASEYGRDYTASVEGIVIPAAWVKAAVDADEKLGLKPSGAKTLALDVADEGIDKNGACGGQGFEIDLLREWSGKGSDIFATVQRTFDICDAEGYDSFRYDADGLGAGVRGDARIINEKRLEESRRNRKAKLPQIKVVMYRGSAGVFKPDAQADPDVKDKRGRTNKDMFANAKAQAFWNLRRRFLKTYRWVVEGEACSPDEIVSINSKKCGKLLEQFKMELSQATYQINGVGKIVIDKKPDGAKSPNLADAAVAKFAQLSHSDNTGDWVL